MAFINILDDTGRIFIAVNCGSTFKNRIGEITDTNTCAWLCIAHELFNHSIFYPAPILKRNISPNSLHQMATVDDLYLISEHLGCHIIVHYCQKYQDDEIRVYQAVEAVPTHRTRPNLYLALYEHHYYMCDSRIADTSLQYTRAQPLSANTTDSVIALLLEENRRQKELEENDFALAVELAKEDGRQQQVESDLLLAQQYATEA